MRRWTLFVIALGAYAFGLILTAPATLVDSGLRRASEGRLRLAEAQGTLWAGTGQLEILDTGRRFGVARALAWRILPASLLRGHVTLELGIGLDAAGKRFPVTGSWSQIEIADADINLPAAVLGLALPKLAPLGLTGEVLLHVTRLAITRTGVQGNATLQWRSAGSTLTPIAPLGDYELRIDTEGSRVRASLRTLQGPIQLDGNGAWANGGRPAFAATARVPVEHRQQLAPLLRLIAVERSDGNFELQLN